MVYNLISTSANSVTPGIKTFIVDGGLESILIPGMNAMIVSKPYWMSGVIVGYKKGRLVIDVDKTNSKEKDGYSETWNITVDTEYSSPESEEILTEPYENPKQDVTFVENPYINQTVVPQENKYINTETQVFTPAVASYTPSVVEGYTGLIGQMILFYMKYKIQILILSVALIIGIIIFFVFKNKSSDNSIRNIIAAFG
jgi:hypothetical protein